MPAAYDALVNKLKKKKKVGNAYALAHAIMDKTVAHPMKGKR